MRNTLTLLAATLLLLLGGCQGSAPIKPEAPAAEAEKPALSDEARQALAKAEADVKEAKSKKALWTTAEDALKKAQDAAASNDSTATLKFSKTASDHARLGLEQKNYPLTQ